jgi:hypothetical protein
LLVRPTMFASTPRLWNILYSRYQEELAAERKRKEDELGGGDEPRELTPDELRAIELPLLDKYEKTLGGTHANKKTHA